ncbi:MAG: response regulator [Paracoccaceae bacterium]|nr:response regulator [Paracoccaceae bacterium]
MIFSKSLHSTKKLSDSTATAAFVAFFLTLAVCGTLYIQTLNSLTESQSETRQLETKLNDLESDLANLTIAAKNALIETPQAQNLVIFRENFEALFAMTHNDISGAFVSPLDDTQLADIILEIDNIVPFIYPVDADLLAALPEVIIRVKKITGMCNALRLLNANALMDLQRQANQKTVTLVNILSVTGLIGLLIIIVALAATRLQLLSRTSNAVAFKRVQGTLGGFIRFSSDAVVSLNHSGDITDANTAALNLFGSWPPVTTLTDIRDRIETTADSIALNSTVGKIFTSQTAPGDQSLVKFEIRGEDDRLHPIEASLIPQLDDTLIIVLKDLSRQLNYKHKLEEAQSEARDEEKMTSRFMASMSHELRTPLNGIVASTELLRETTKLDDQQAWLTNISEHYSKAALEQLSNLLEFNRLLNPERSKAAVTHFSPADTMAEVVGQHQDAAKSHNNTLVFNKPAYVTHAVIGSEKHFALTIIHLVRSALKFTNSGRIELALSARASTRESTVSMDITVRDSTTTPPDDTLSPVLENFRSLESAYTKTTSGSGLSLGIAKRAAEIMGGQVLVDAATDRGCRFSVALTLPLAEKTQDSAISPAPTSDQKLTEIDDSNDIGFEQSLRLLVAEDDEIYRSLLVASLHLDGHDIAEAKDGQQAIDHAQNRQFDAVLMDISMPRMSGLTATKIIRQSAPNKTVPIIGLTAHALPEQIDEFLAAGMDDLIIKPVRKEALRAVLYRAYLRQHHPLDTDTNDTSEKNETMRETTSDLIEIEVFDALKNLVDAETLRSYLTQFVAECEAAVDSMKAQTSAEELPEAGETAHKAAGFAAVVGATGVQRLLNEFETAAKSGDEDHCATLPDRVHDLILPSYELLEERLE